ncbi:MAG: carbamoyl-phosphate synthase small subunit [Gammaproteobacteria bacterium]|nr:carbamoyl-phosphate synthase small subunit [Gammaproteobacteria bacterium]
MTVEAILALEDGTIFTGTSIGVNGHAIGEVVFNTSMTGYQEILTDPSYCQQIVTLTYPHIGNTGTNIEDMESRKTQASGLIIRNSSLVESSWRSTQSLNGFLESSNTVAIADIDTRKLTQLLREKGAQSGCIMAGEIDENIAIKNAKAFPGLLGMDLAKKVTTNQPYEWAEGSLYENRLSASKKDDLKYHVVAYDYGVKTNILRLLVDLGCKITVVPAEMPANDVIALNPDGVFLSNGPGDPDACKYAIEAIKHFIDHSVPVFGICLGYQLLALASGAKTIKMKFGHHGANHPVLDLNTGKVIITSQNHGFAVEESSLPSNIKVTHKSLFDHTLQGIEIENKNAFGFQGHPEASPGPQDLMGLFNKFIKMLKNK